MINLLSFTQDELKQILLYKKFFSGKNHRQLPNFWWLSFTKSLGTDYMVYTTDKSFFSRNCFYSSFRTLFLLMYILSKWPTSLWWHFFTNGTISLNEAIWIIIMFFDVREIISLNSEKSQAIFGQLSMVDTSFIINKWFLWIESRSFHLRHLTTLFFGKASRNSPFRLEVFWNNVPKLIKPEKEYLKI